MAKTRTNDPQVFALAIGDFVTKAKAQPKQVVRKVGVDIVSSLVMKSPVDTGRFRYNWVCSFDTASSFTTTNTDKTGQKAIAMIRTQLNGWEGQDIYFTNSLPYAIPLEYGHSQQAPQGMVRLTVGEWNDFVARAVQEADQ